MNAHALCESIQFSACFALARLSADARGVAVAVVDAGGVPPLFTALSNHLSSSDVIRSAAEALRKISLARYYDSDDVITLSNTDPQHLFAAMEAHLDCVEIQEIACDVLRVLCESKANCVLIVSSGGLDCLIDVMSAHLTSETVQRYSCRALSPLLASIPDNRRTMVTAGALPRLFAAMEAHRSFGGLQTEALLTLSNLACNGPIAATIVNIGGLSHVYAALAQHHASEEVSAASCLLLSRLCHWQCEDNHDCQARIVATGFLQHVYAAMEAQADSE